MDEPPHTANNELVMLVRRTQPARSRAGSVGCLLSRVSPRCTPAGCVGLRPRGPLRTEYSEWQTSPSCHHPNARCRSPCSLVTHRSPLDPQSCLIVLPRLSPVITNSISSGDRASSCPAERARLRASPAPPQQASRLPCPALTAHRTTTAGDILYARRLRPPRLSLTLSLSRRRATSAACHRR